METSTKKFFYPLNGIYAVLVQSVAHMKGLCHHDLHINYTVVVRTNDLITLHSQICICLRIRMVQPLHVMNMEKRFTVACVSRPKN